MNWFNIVLWNISMSSVEEYSLSTIRDLLVWTFLFLYLCNFVSNVIISSLQIQELLTKLISNVK